MKPTKTKATLVKILALDHVKKSLNKANKPVLVFVLTLFLGVVIAFGLGYLYSFYNDNLFATEGIRDTLTYQGKIVNADGVPPPDGNYNLQFKIFDSQTSGNLLWTEIWDGEAHTGHLTTSEVSVNQGVFTVELNSLCRNWVGDCASNGGVTFSQDSFYLQVELDYDANGTFEEIFTPRKRFTATPYSMNADKLDGRESTDFVLKSGATMTGELLSPKVTDNSVIAYYQFNGTANNSSSNANLDGSLQDSANTNYDSLNLDGNGDYVLVNDNNLLSFGNGTLDSVFTFSAWINMNNAINFPILSKGVYNTNAEYWLGTDVDAKLNIRIYDESVADCYIGRKYTATGLDPSTWMQITATYDGSGNSSGLKLYINGERVDDADSAIECSYIAMENLASGLNLGRNDATYANGSIDDIKLQNRVQTADEIRRLFDNTKSRYINADSVNTFTLYLYGLNETTHQTTYGNLYFDPVLNRIVSNNEIFIPNNMPSLDNAGNSQDYNHFADEHKILAYDFADTDEGSIIDLEGNANGTYSGQANFVNAGFIGYGFSFDYSNNQILFSDPGISTTAGTFEIWAKLNNIATSETNYLAYFRETGGTQFELVKQGTADLYAKVADSSLVDTTYDIPDTNWHHYAITWAGTSYEVFVDGISVYDGTYTTFTTPTTFLLGYGNTADTALNGTMDSVALYDDVLTDAEILNHAQSAYNSLYINDKLRSGLTSSSLENLISLPVTLNQKNIYDPVYFEYTGSKNLNLAFSEGFGTKTYSYNNSDIYATINSATWIKDGFFGHALSFDGADDYLELADDERLDMGTNDFAIEFWINGSALGNNNNKVISKRDGDTGYEIYYNSTTDSLRFFIGDGTNTVNSAATSTDYSDGNWHHFLVSFDMGGNASIFRDGNVFDMSTVDISSVTGSISNSANLLIGKDSGGNYFNGKLDSIIIYDLNGSTQFNIYDSYSRVLKAPDSLFVIGKNSQNNSSTLAVLNQSDNGHAGIFGMKNSNNTSNYPLAIWNDNGSSDIYNLIYFGTTTLGGGGSSNEYGNLKWDVANDKFILSQSIAIEGYLATDSNELLAYDVVRHTVTSGEAAAGTFSVSWGKSITQDKIVDLRAITLDLSPDPDEVWADEWSSGFDQGVKFDGTNFTVNVLNSTWSENDIVTIYIVYEK